MNQLLFLGVPFNAGQGHRGTADAPSFFRHRASDLFSSGLWRDLGDVMPPPFRGLQAGLWHAHELSKKIQTLKLERNFLALMGGDHAMGLGTVHGLLYHYPELIVVWIDAHADANIPSSSPSGNMHGMPLSWLLGADEGAPWWLQRTLASRKLIYVGVRDLDPYERMLIEELDITWISPAELRKAPIHQLVKHHLKRLDPKGRCPVHISLDVDALDASLVYCTGTRVPDGLTFSEVEQIVQALKDQAQIVSTEIVEINPELGSREESHHLMDWSLSLFSYLASQTQHSILPAQPETSFMRFSQLSTQF